MVFMPASVRRVVLVAFGWLLLHTCVVATAGAASLVDLDRDHDVDLVAIDEAGQLTVWSNRDDLFGAERPRAWPFRASLTNTGPCLPPTSVGLLAELDSVEKHVTRRDVLPPARPPSPVGSTALSPGPRLVRPVAAIPFCPRPPPRLA